MSIKFSERDYYGKQAIVIGGSFSGLIAARILADFFQQVIIIDRDREPDEKTFQNRLGVPHGYHSHFMKTKAAAFLQEIFPEIDAALIANGAYKIDALNDVLYCIVGKKITFKSDKFTYLQSRPLLENTIRSLVKKRANIIFMYGCFVDQVLIDKATNRITGIHYKEIKTFAQKQLSADLVVDASGRQTQMPVWLQEHIGKTIEKEELLVDICYVTRIYRLPKEVLERYKAVVILPLFKRRRAAVMHAIEDDAKGKRWLVSLIGMYGDIPPRSAEGFLSFTKGLVDTDIYEAIKLGKPLTDSKIFKFPTIRRYHYEKYEDLPSGMLAIGDAMSILNPRLGLGLTTSACAANVLQQLLSAGKENYLLRLKANYFKKTAAVTNTPWLFFEIPFVLDNTGIKPTWSRRITNQFKTMLLDSANYNSNIWRIMFELYSLDRRPNFSTYFALFIYYVQYVFKRNFTNKKKL